MNKRTTIIISVFVAFVLGATISFLFTPTTDDIPYTVLDDSSIESHITKSYLDNGNLIIDIYNPNCEIVKVESAILEYHVTAGMDSIKIFNYTDQYFEVIVGNASDVYTFGSLTKTWDAKNKAVTIKSNGVPSMTVKLISSEPDICTFTEIFEVTNFKAFTPHKDKDFKARTVKHKGKKDVTKVEWFVEQNISYVADNETRYKNVWQEYNHHSKPVSKDTVQRIKVVYHKLPEIGEVKIQTIPLFRGVECDELTWWNTSWGGRRNITIDHTQVDDDMVNFPVMVSITQLGLNTNGNDTRVTDSSDNQVAREIECYNETSGELVFHFNGTSISSTSNTSFWMYYDNSAAIEPAADSTYGSQAVWDSNFKAVYHMNYEPNGAGASTLLDSTSNAYHQSPHGFTTDSLVDGEYGKGIAFDDTDDYFDRTAAAVSTGTWDILIQHKTGSDITDFANLISARGEIQYYVVQHLCIYNGYHATYDDAWVYAPTALSTNTEYIASFNYATAGTLSYYLDGVSTGSDTVNSAKDNCEIRTIGAMDAPDRYYNRNIYEIRYSDTARSSDYITTTHNNLNNPTASGTAPFFASFGAGEDSFGITSYAPSTPVNKLKGESQYFNVTTDVNCQCRWYINGTLKQTNTTQQTDHNYTNTSLELGYFNFSAVVNTTDGATDIQTWWVTVGSIATYIPPPPVLSNTTGGDFWVNFTWTPGSGNTTNSYNVSYNDVWDNGTTTTHRNESVSGGGWLNITVCAWNSSGVGTLSDTCVEDSIEAPSYKPPEPINLANTTGNFWVNHTWQADSGNVTDYWNVSVNDVWYNRSYPWYNETYSAHDWQNISVWAWNNTAQGTMSD